MPTFLSFGFSSRWSTLRIVVATLVVAAFMNSVIGHFGMKIDAARVQQIQIAQAHEALETAANDLDRLLLDEPGVPVAIDLANLSSQVEDVCAFQEDRATRPLRAAFSKFREAVDRQTGCLKEGDRTQATLVDHTMTDPAVSQVEATLDEMDRRSQERAETRLKATYGASLFTLLLSAGLVSHFAVRHRKRTNELAKLEVERRSLEAERQAEHRSQWTRTLLEAQIHSSFDGILIVDLQGKIVLQNSRMSDLWGLPEEILQSDDDERQVAYVLSMVKDPETFASSVKALYAAPLRTQHDEIEMLDGRVLDRHTGPAIATDGTVYGRFWTFRDITNRIRTQKALRESEANLLGLMESIPQIVWKCLPDGRNLFFSHQWAAYTGQSAEDGREHGWYAAIHPDDRQGADHLAGDQVFEVENRLLGKDGTYRWFLIRGIPTRDESGRIFQWFGTCTDIDALKKSEGLLREAHEALESRVEERTRDLAAATLEAERANAAKSEFLSRMSHELRTPLNAILGFGQILQRQKLDDLQRESVDYILKGGRHLLGLINEILDIARVEAGRADLSIEPVMVSEVLDESFAMVRNAALDGGIVLDENLRAFEGVCVTADRQRLKQVFINLLGNAVKYNRPGGRVAARLSHDGEGTFRIAIEDTGLGISEEGLSKLFLPFERLSPGTNVEGTGLGLFLTRKLVAAMGGDVEVESRLGVGSTFSVALARAKVPTEAFLTLECQPMALPYESGERPVSILSIEDNSANTRLMEMVLAARPDAVLTTATHGMEGLQAARQKEPDLILLDINLPDVSGIEVLKRLRRSATTAHIPVVVVSADASESKVDAVLAAGADAFLTKPISVDRFLRTIDQHLLRSGAADVPLKEAA